MQKIIFHNSKRGRLVGVLHLPKRKTDRVFIIAHGFTSTKDRPRFKKIAQALVNNDFATFRFDFGGCGESQEREIRVKDQVDDLKSAIKLMQQKGFAKIGLIGESLGGLTAILTYDPKIIKTLILLAPVTKSKEVLTEEKYQKQFEKYGFAFYEKDGRKFKIPKEYLKERLNVNQKEILTRIKCPTLIIHGDKDNIIPLDHSKEALKYLPPGSRLKIIQGANHMFEGKVEKIIEEVLQWVKKNVK